MADLDLRLMTTEDGLRAACDAIASYLESGAPHGRTCADFVKIFASNPHGARYGASNLNGLPVSRVIDRALQKLRKNARIDYHKREWFILKERI